jgi:hypothetical protein
MKPTAAFSAAILFCLTFCAVAQEAPPSLFGVPGSWGVSTAEREGFSPVAPGLWAGRLPEGEEAAPFPPAPFRLPRGGNPWAGFAYPALSMRYEKMLAWLWSRTGALPEGRKESFSFKDAAGGTRKVRMVLTDAETGVATPLSATHRLRQGRLLSHNVGPNLGDVFLYTGSIEDGAVAWHVVTGPTEEGPLAFQARFASMDGRERFFTLSVGIDPPEGGGNDVVPAPFEPRDVIRLDDGSLLFRFALTPKTLNFPCIATFALSVGEKGAPRLPPAVPVPDGAPEITPASFVLAAPGGTVFRDGPDALAYLEARASGLFADAAACEAVAASLARDGSGAPRVALRDGGKEAVFFPNPDPDLETSFNPGSDTAGGRPSRIRPNRAERLLAEALAADGDVVVRATAGDLLDYGECALRMADHPATFADGDFRPAVRLAHAECEFLSALSRRLHADGRKLVVRDASPGRTFSAAAADGVAE